MSSLINLLLAGPTLAVQLTLAAIYSGIWYFLMNHFLVPVGVSVIENIKAKKRFIHFNRESFKKIQLDIGNDEEEQILAISRIAAVMVNHLVGAIMFFPSAFGIGLTGNFSAALAAHGGLSEMGWEIQDLISRCYEIVFGGERGRKLNPLALMLLVVAHHSLACSTAVIPMNIYYPNNHDWTEVFCTVQIGSFVSRFMQQYGYTLDVHTREGLNKMKIAISISFFTCLWTRVLRYSWILKSIYDGFVEDGNWWFISLGAGPSLLLSVVNFVMVKNAWQKFSKFVAMDIRKH